MASRFCWSMVRVSSRPLFIIFPSSQLPAKRPVQQRREQVIQPAVALGLLGLQRSHLRHLGGKLALEGERRHSHLESLDNLGIPAFHDRTTTNRPSLLFDSLIKKECSPEVHRVNSLTIDCDDAQVLCTDTLRQILGGNTRVPDSAHNGHENISGVNTKPLKQIVFLRCNASRMCPAKFVGYYVVYPEH